MTRFLPIALGLLFAFPSDSFPGRLKCFFQAVQERFADHNSLHRFETSELRQSDISPGDVDLTRPKNSGLFKSQLSYTPLTPLTNRPVDPVEEVLKNSKVGEIEYPGKGNNRPSIVTFTSGQRAVWKPHNEVWFSNYRAEVLAYEIDRLIGFNLVPVTVERVIEGQKGSMQLFKFTHGGNTDLQELELAKQSLFDLIIDNRDRHGGNFLVSPLGKVISIDNGVSFTGLGNHGRSFFERRPEIHRFMNSNDGRRIMRNLESINLNELEVEVSAYLGEEDTKKLIRRVKIVLKEYQKLKR